MQLKLTYIHIHTHTYTYIHIHTHTYTYIHIHTLADTYIHIHAHTCTYMHIHAHTYTNKYTYKHIHIQQNNGEAHNILGVARRKEGLDGLAEESYQKAGTLMPQSPEPAYNLAVLYMVIYIHTHTHILFLEPAYNPTVL
jgi:hypothetical protein